MIKSIKSFLFSHVSRNNDNEYSLIKDYFDQNYYIGSYPDIANAMQKGLDPVRHYLDYGAREGRNPNNYFITENHIKNNPNVDFSTINPFAHFLVNANAEELEVIKNKKYSIYQSPDYLIVSEEFDHNFYKLRYSEKFYIAQDLVEHYLVEGEKNGYWPNAYFDPIVYETFNPDVAKSGLNLFRHYIENGKKEGRICNLNRKEDRGILKSINPVHEQAKEWKKQNLIITDINEFKVRLHESIKGRSKSVISISHDDYKINRGGIQLCISMEMSRCLDGEMNHIHLSPVQPLPMLAVENRDYNLDVVVNGNRIGSVSIMLFISMISSAKINVEEILIHSFLGHSPEEITLLIRNLNSKVQIWVHDFFTLCEGYTLLRNGVTYCGAPDVMSKSCSICVYGINRDNHIARIKEFFSNFAPNLIFPSYFAHDLWLKRNPDLKYSKAKIISHCKLEKRPNFNETTNSLKIAFVGSNTANKGYNFFQDLAIHFIAYENISFYNFSTQPVHSTNVTNVIVNNKTINPANVSNAIYNKNISFVVIWPKCPETFSFTMFEALAGSALILTHGNAGNVTDYLKDSPDLGIIFDDEYALISFLKDLLAIPQIKLSKPQVTLTYYAGN